MLAQLHPHGSFGRSESWHPPKYLSLEQLQLPRKPSTQSRKFGKVQKLRLVTSAAPAYRPSSSETGHTKKFIRPKQEPLSPNMSGYNYASGDQNYSYVTTNQTSVPQYTQSQINQYYTQYQTYPPQPYHIIPDYYVQQIPAVQQAYHQPIITTMNDTANWQSQPDLPTVPSAQGTARSNSRVRTWNCDIPNCSSSANFTRLADLQRHQSTVHGIGTPEYPCTVPRCSRVGDKGFTRRDHLVEHLRNFHHIDIPKRRPGERSAFPFGWPEGGLGEASQ
ncbi:hypothetical protein ACN47E_004308 [Coniothyrium glycines]